MTHKERVFARAIGSCLIRGFALLELPHAVLVLCCALLTNWTWDLGPRRLDRGVSRLP